MTNFEKQWYLSKAEKRRAKLDQKHQIQSAKTQIQFILVVSFISLMIFTAWTLWMAFNG